MKGTDVQGLEVLGRTTTHLLRVFVDIGMGLCKNVLDLIDPWLQFSVFEDG